MRKLFTGRIAVAVATAAAAVAGTIAIAQPASAPRTPTVACSN